MTKKPQLGFRKPPSVDPDEFVFQENQAPTSQPAQAPKRSSAEESRRSAVQAPKAARKTEKRGAVESGAGGRKKTIVRGDGRVLRRISVYFPIDVAKRLVTHCAAEDMEVSAYVTELVRRSLGA